VDERIEGVVFLPIGFEALTVIDEADLVTISGWKLTIHVDQNGRRYVAARRYVEGRRESVPVHRLILGLVKGDDHVADHIDGDGLNNCRANLRIATRSNNMWNRKPNRISTSQFKGVGFYPSKNCWRSRIKANGKVKHIGYFTSEIDAAKAYDIIAGELHGEFALLNFPVVKGITWTSV
jgi:hypothetical protein